MLKFYKTSLHRMFLFEFGEWAWSEGHLNELNEVKEYEMKDHIQKNAETIIWYLENIGADTLSVNNLNSKDLSNMQKLLRSLDMGSVDIVSWVGLDSVVAKIDEFAGLCKEACDISRVSQQEIRTELSLNKWTESPIVKTFDELPSFEEYTKIHDYNKSIWSSISADWLDLSNATDYYKFLSGNGLLRADMSEWPMSHQVKIDGKDYINAISWEFTSFRSHPDNRNVLISLDGDKYLESAALTSLNTRYPIEHNWKTYFAAENVQWESFLISIDGDRKMILTGRYDYVTPSETVDYNWKTYVKIVAEWFEYFMSFDWDELLKEQAVNHIDSKRTFDFGWTKYMRAAENVGNDFLVSFDWKTLFKDQWLDHLWIDNVIEHEWKPYMEAIDSRWKIIYIAPDGDKLSKRNQRRYKNVW